MLFSLKQIYKKQVKFLDKWRIQQECFFLYEISEYIIISSINREVTWTNYLIQITKKINKNNTVIEKEMMADTTLYKEYPSYSFNFYFYLYYIWYF